jgi:hypothetical protein
MFFCNHISRMLPQEHFEIVVGAASAHPCVGMGPNTFQIQVTKLVVKMLRVSIP